MTAVKARAIVRIGDGVTALGVYASDTFADVAQATSVTFQPGQKSELPTEHLLSTFKDWVSDIPEAGTVEFELLFDSEDTVHILLRDKSLLIATQYNFELEHQVPAAGSFILGVKYQFYGEIMNFAHDWPGGDVAKANVTIKLQSLPTMVEI